MMHAAWFRPALLAALAISLVFRPASRVSADVEPNDVLQQAERIEPGTRRGSVGQEGDRKDVYGFPVSGGRIIHLVMEPTEGDEKAAVRLLSADGSGLARLSNESGRECKYFTAAELGQATFFAEVSGSGPYTFKLEITAQNDGGREVDAPADTARAVAVGPGRYEGALGNDDKTDAYAFKVAGGDIVKAAMPETEGDAGVLIRLFDHRMSGITHFERGHEREFSYVTPAELGDQTFYVTAGGSGNYAFELSKSRQNDAGLGGDAPTDMREGFQVGPGVIRGTVGPPDKSDCYRFSAAEGQKVELEFQADFSRFAREMPAITAILMDPRDSQVANVKSSGALAPLAYGPIPGGDAGEWKLVVYGEGDYTLNLGLKGADAAPTAGAGQPSAAGASQTVEFSAGLRFEYLIPVKTAGPLTVKATWTPSVGATAYLFSPGQKKPAAQTSGTGSVALSHSIPASAAGKDWMLQIEIAGPSPSARGNLAVSWPGAPTDKLTWKTDMPDDPRVKAALEQKMDSIRRLQAGQEAQNESERAYWQAISQDPELRAGLTSIERVFTARAASLAASPGLLTTSSTTVSLEPSSLPDGTQVAQPRPVGTATQIEQPVGGLTQAQTPQQSVQGEEEQAPMVIIYWLAMRCNEETSWDGLSDSDEPYFCAGVAVEGESHARGRRSDVFQDVDSGETRPGNDIANDIMWFGRIPDRACFSVLFLEHDKSSPDTALQNFLLALNDASAYISTGPSSWSNDERLLETVFTFTFAYWYDRMSGWGLDDIIGSPQRVVVTPEKLNYWKGVTTRYGPGWIETLNFRGDGANYSVMFRIEVQ